MNETIDETQTSLKTAAMRFAGHGWGVFPCSPEDKRPLVGESAPGAGDAGLYRATRDKDQINRWWSQWPHAMIGLATGEAIGVFVVDLDPKGDKTADDLLEDLRQAVGGRLPACPVVRTPRGGLHLYFTMPAGVAIGNRANLLKAPKGAAMIDVRGTGGYVILPPSKRRGQKAAQEGCEGVSYRWEESDWRGLEPPEAPYGLVQLIVQRDGKADEPPAERRPLSQRATPQAQHGERARRYALAALDGETREVQNAGSGMRNTTLNNAALRLGSLVAHGLLAEAVVISSLESAAESCCLVKDDGWKSVRATIQSGFKAGLSKPRDLSDLRDPGPRDSARQPEGPPPEAPPYGDVGAPPPEPPQDTDGDETDPRRVVQLRAGRLHEAIRDIERIMTEEGPGPAYQRSGELVHIVRRPVRRSDGSEETQEVVGNIEPAGLLCDWSRRIRFERFDARQKKWIPVDPPAKLAEAYFSQSDWRMENLHHLIATPTLRPDGSLLIKPGYDEATGLYLTSSLPGLKVPERPTDADAEDALTVLTELFNAFPYADRDDPKRAGLGQSVAVAGVMTAVLRPTLPAAPLFGITGPKAGTGKSYLVDLISTIATGRGATCLVSGVKLEEFEKALGAALLASLPLLSLDNMVQPVTGQLICMALSQERIDMRVLGVSKTANLPTTTAMFATGNNLKLKGDLSRRALLCRLDARVERPEERTFEVDLLQEAKKRRAELVSAALTIARWGFVRREGRRDWSLDDPQLGRPFAGFQTWCRRVRDPLVALGCQDPVQTLDDVRAADPSAELLRVLMAAWEKELQDKSVICKKAIYDANALSGDLQSAMDAVAGDRGGEVNPRKLSAFLSDHEGSPVDLAVEDEEPRVKAFYRDGKYQNALRWQLRTVSVS